MWVAEGEWGPVQEDHVGASEGMEYEVGVQVARAGVWCEGKVGERLQQM